MNRTQSIVIIMLLLIGGGRSVSAAEVDINGYYKNYSLGFDAPGYIGLPAADQEPWTGTVTNRVRLNLLYRANDRLSASISYNLVPRVQDHSLSEQSNAVDDVRFPSYRLVDFDSRLYPAPSEGPHSFGIFHNLDRAFVTITTTHADVYLGRQAIAWGSARAINPTDILAPFAFDELDTEDRRGIDAARLRVPLGMMGELDAGYVFGPDGAVDNSAAYLRTKAYIARADVSFLAAAFREHLLVGLDITRAVGGASVWLETAYVFVDLMWSFSHRYHWEDDYFRASLGLDHALSPTVYGFIEYHFSEAGSNHARDYHTLTTRPAFTDGAVYLWGTHYVIPGITWEITPLISGSAQSLFNITDQSVLVTPQIEYNIAEDMYLAAGAYIGLGSSPGIIKTYDGDDTVIYQSEFGAYSDMYFASFRVYF